MTVRIAHFNIRVLDPVASVAFYRRLGLDIVGCLHLGPGHYQIYLGTAGDLAYTLELGVREDAGPDYERIPGTGHVALAVGDLDALLSRLERAGISPESEPHVVALDGNGPRICFVTDPDGVRVELIDGSYPAPQDPLPASLAR